MYSTNYEWLDLDMQPETHKGTSNEVIEGMISAGRPVMFDVMQMADAGKKPLEPDVALSLPTYNFFYLRFPLNIKPADKHHINLISLEIDIQSPDDDAICWSMDPLRIETEKKLTAEAEITSGLKLKVLELGTGEKATEEYVQYTAQIEAFGLMQSNPAWELRSLESRKLSGVHLFHMVVRASKDKVVKVVVRMRAEIKKERFIFSYMVAKKDNSLDLFSLSLS